jgi:transmembrane sensor
MSNEEQRLDEAIAWHVRLNSGDADEALWFAFTTWLELDAANRMAYDRVEDLDAGIDPVIGREPALLQFQRTLPATRHRWIAAAALLAASLLLAIGVATRTYLPAPVQYATRIGETKTVNLPDGSIVTLNTGTTIVVAISNGSRAVTLERGEALFRVAKDAAHPFVVTVGDRSIRVVGTLFDVLRDAGTVTVVVAEGRVAVSRRGADSEVTEVQLAPGQRATGREGSPVETLEKVDAARALAWRDGYLIYDNAPLSGVVKDLNRYFPVPIALADGSVAAHRFSGVLRIDSENAVLARIAQFLPVHVQYVRGGIVLHDTRKPD